MLGSGSDNTQAHQDSLFIYNYYKGSIEVLKNTTYPQKWYELNDSLDRATACAFRRLSLHNKSPYKPAKKFDRQGVGEAYDFPTPYDREQIAFTVIERQTKFLVSDNGRKKTPYIEKLCFNKAHELVKTEKLDPITLKPLPEESKPLLVNSE